MPSRIKYGLLIGLIFVGLFLRAEYGYGAVIRYYYDKTGNLIYRGAPDTTPPTTTADPPGGIYGPGLAVTLTCSDGNGAGCENSYYTTDGSTWQLYTSPIPISVDTTLSFYSIDLADNSESPKTENYVVDTVPPTGTIIINSGAAFTNNTSVTLTLTCTDANGCSRMQFSNTNDPGSYSTPEPYATSKAWIMTSGDGNKTVYVKFKDTLGNWSIPYSDTIQLHTTPPTGTIVIESGAAFTSSITVTLTLSCSDNVGCSQMQFSNDNVTYSTPETYGITKAWTLIPGNGTKTVYVKFKDTVGNWSIAFSDTIDLNTSCSSSPARIGSTPYPTIQDAYNVAGSGDTIKCLGTRITETLSLNGNIAVTLEGGYDCGYTTNVGTMTPMKGMLTVGSGTVTIKNFVLEK